LCIKVTVDNVYNSKSSLLNIYSNVCDGQEDQIEKKYDPDHADVKRGDNKRRDRKGGDRKRGDDSYDDNSAAKF
ncbi:hypothetical protein PFDG_05311, partial [Plasmodium falciparum Dd2]